MSLRGMLFGLNKTPPPPPLDPPANLALSITGTSKDVITATWDAVSGASDYEVEYSDDGVTYAPVDTTALLTYGVTSADYALGEDIHYVRVRATGGEDWSVASIANTLIGTLSRYSMNEASGNSRVDTIGGRTLTESGGAIASATGKLSDAASFAGSGKKLVSTAFPDLSAAFTIAFWYFPVTGGGTGILSFGDEAEPVEIRLLRTGTSVQESGYTGQNIEVAGLTLDAWNLCIITFNGTTTTLSVNAGTRDSGAYVPTAADLGSPVLNIGIANGQAWGDFRIDELIIANRAWTEAEEDYFYNGGTGRAYPYS